MRWVGGYGLIMQAITIGVNEKCVEFHDQDERLQELSLLEEPMESGRRKGYESVV